MLYKFRLFPTKKQVTLFKIQLEEHRLLYNHCLEQRINLWKNEQKSISCFDLIKKFVKQFKKQSNYSSLQQTVRRLDKTYQKFFKGDGFPRFKSKERFRTIEYGKHGDGCKVKQDSIYLQNIGNIKCNFHRLFGTPKTLSVTLKNDKMYVNIFVEEVKPTNLVKSPVIGIDFGIKNTVTLSNGIQFQSPEPQKEYKKQIARLSRNKNYKALNKVYTRITNIRKDFNHKLSRQLANQYNTICLEDLKVQNIQSFTPVNRKLNDINLTQLKQFIVYKAENAGKHVVLVDPAYTTQICSNCGTTVEKDLTERTHSCLCGLILDRDHNAAINILRLGLQSLGNLEAS